MNNPANPVRMPICGHETLYLMSTSWHSENRENEGTRSVQQSQFVSLPHTIRVLCASTNF